MSTDVLAIAMDVTTGRELAIHAFVHSPPTPAQSTRRCTQYDQILSFWSCLIQRKFIFVCGSSVGPRASPCNVPDKRVGAGDCGVGEVRIGDLSFGFDVALLASKRLTLHAMYAPECTTAGTAGMASSVLVHQLNY